ncbi:transcriptional regulator [Bacillus pseudomycoides]|uniref:helix-turn-helix transcriptional regulator n=1 Tax=Bacillus pseudomycoides TaxID=64104 RepID=UPI000BED7E34|nr:helix-turn-helix transcriptional regulator [Bacillus pseudomycoides]PDZ12989.1 transcriptional regulator [Bacillus pseudomycoides]
MTIYNRVKELRARFNFTQSVLAQKVGVTRQTIAAIEKGDYVPSLLLALTICDVFGLKMEDVFGLKMEDVFVLNKEGEKGE